jgi:hypothetical protein
LVLGFGSGLAGVAFSARAGGGAVLDVEGEVAARVLGVELVAPEHHKGERKVMMQRNSAMRGYTELSTAR